MKYYIFKKGKDGYLYPESKGKFKIKDVGFNTLKTLEDFQICLDYIGEMYCMEVLLNSSSIFHKEFMKTHKIFIETNK